MITVIIIGGILLLLFARLKSRNDDEMVEYTPSSPQPAPIPPTPQMTERLFTLAELKRAEDGKYNWDENGCVFEINSDGSVTIIGRFDPAELLVDPVQEMIERLNNDGLIEMLPRMCCFHTVSDKGGDDDAFLLVWNDDILSVQTCPHTIDDVKSTSLILSSFETGKSVITQILSKIEYGYLTLMPSNEKEYILSLGAKACVERAVGNKVRVKIGSPAVMGAYGIAIARSGNKKSEISFAFGDGEDYMCCNLIADEGIYEVKKLLRSSIIQPTETFTALNHIAKGCMVQSLIREGRVMDYCLIDMIPYTMSLLLKENGRVIKIYDYISETTSIPTKRGDKDINVDATKTLSFLIGSTELIDDVMDECNAPNGKIGAFIELDSNMDVEIKITSQYNDYKIKVGQLIG